MAVEVTDSRLQDIRQLMQSIISNESAAAVGDDSCWAVAATQRRPARCAPEAQAAAAPPVAPAAPRRAVDVSTPFTPLAPQSLREAGLTESQVEALVLKFLLNRGNASGRTIADQVALPFNLMEKFLLTLKGERLITLKASAVLGDFQYEVTDLGAERARRYSQLCTYFGAAPVPLDVYADSVRRQCIATKKPSLAEIRAAFADLALNDNMLARIGRALHGGRGLFLYGASGNGKTSIAERLTRAFGGAIWIPRAISTGGDIIRVFDPLHHHAAEPDPAMAGLPRDTFDRRWLRIARPTIVAGGELTLENLEVNLNPATGIGEAPLQMKSNGGTLVIDDLGRQRVSPQELLNRWIVPLEKHYDYLNMANGRRIQVPFEQLMVFSTNLEPRDLVDEAFLRRLPYKIEVLNPTEDDFRGLLARIASEKGIRFDGPLLDYLIHHHYRGVSRPIRNCHARDILSQIANFCGFHGLPLAATREAIDAAVEDYFSIV